MDEPFRVLLVDDQPLFRGAIAALLDAEPGIDVVGEAKDGLDAVEQAHELQPDLIIMDVEMPRVGGVEATRLIREQLPAIKIVMLTVSETDDNLFDAIRYGAHGYLLKDLRPHQLCEMLRSVMRNETPLSPAIAGRLLGEFRAQGLRPRTVAAEPADLMASITRRELEILQLVADGLTNKEIGKKLFITEGTVKNHVHNALEKLRVENRVQAAAYIVRQGRGRRPPDTSPSQ